jgi:hypothetical protein
VKHGPYVVPPVRASVPCRSGPSFLAPLPDAEGLETHVRVTVLAAPADAQRFAVAVVLVARPGTCTGSAAGSCRCSGCW